ncbi:hypothetical protein T10_9829 [Trichinella papuae]|uniref:Uncharacterized protein n=1 Tax=Trichinella papuae TaxID=268474 RepID=A0A0V1MHL2_9BILA|nr:hypothetical protein T10_9829 [Trichinella papuae]
MIGCRHWLRLCTLRKKSIFDDGMFPLVYSKFIRANHSLLACLPTLLRSSDRFLASYQFHNTVQDDNNKFISFSIINQKLKLKNSASSLFNNSKQHSVINLLQEID